MNFLSSIFKQLRLGILLTGALLVLLQYAATSQPRKDTRIDSLNNVLTKAKDDTNKVLLLNQLALAYPNFDPNKGYEVSEQAMALSQNLKWEKGKALSLVGMGLNEESRAHYIEARNRFLEARAIAQELEDRNFEGRILKNLGITYFNQDNYPEALKYFFDAEAIEEDLHNALEMSINLEYTGRIYEAQKNFDKALEYYKRSYGNAMKAGENKAKVKNLMNIGEVYLAMGKSNEAMSYFEQTLSGFRALNDQSGIAVSLAYISEADAQLHNYGEALSRQKEALDIYIAYADRFIIATVMGNYAKTYLAINADTSGAVIPDSLKDKAQNLKKAFSFLEMTIGLCKEISYLEGLSNSYQLRSLANEQAGNHKEALNDFKEYISLRDSI